MPRRRASRTLRLPRVAVLLTLAAVLTAGATSNIRVKEGDTLWELAQRHNTTVDVLRRLNDLPGSGTIYVGDVLKVPGAAPGKQAPARPSTRVVEKGYTVQAGDNLTLIAKKYGVSVRTIQVRNKLPRNGIVLIGRRLAIPVTVTVTPSRSAAPNSATHNAGLRIPVKVQRSAAAHRAYLAHQRLPSKKAVRALIHKTAKRVGLDPSLALAVAFHESGFQQRVVSPVDAIGVMQVLPSTGRALSAGYHRKLNLLKTEDNVLAGVLLLKQLSRATGRADLALAGYYQGLGSVRKRGMLPQTHAYIRNVTVLRARFRTG
ncbi:MAG: LysM peptidoglycan-binding domain-containing protein [Frankiaceae bacterium]|nr:LysM peptidoglycan-binding domain-containing protein [Frankiaceae bacterium]